MSKNSEKRMFVRIFIDSDIPMGIINEYTDEELFLECIARTRNYKEMMNNGDIKVQRVGFNFNKQIDE